MVYLFYTTYISIDLAYHELFCAKAGKGGILKVYSRLKCIKYETFTLFILHRLHGNALLKLFKDFSSVRNSGYNDNQSG